VIGWSAISQLVRFTSDIGLAGRMSKIHKLILFVFLLMFRYNVGGVWVIGDGKRK
jgi:hypothetical protein